MLYVSFIMYEYFKLCPMALVPLYVQGRENRSTLALCVIRGNLKKKYPKWQQVPYIFLWRSIKKGSSFYW